MSLAEIRNVDSGAAEKKESNPNQQAPFDVLVVGGGPAGSSAAIYAAMRKYSHWHSC